MNRDLVDLYSDYLLSSPVQAGGRLFGATTATGLSDFLEGSISHDQITRFLSQEDFAAKILSKNRAVKGINLLNCVYHAQGVTLPVACELILRQAQEQTPRLS